jgi:dihydrofolate reductase
MRKLIYSINLTLDGCCDHTKGIADENLHRFYADLLRQADTFVYGRKTFELMVPFWPDVARNNSGPNKAFNDFARAFVSAREIVVFSRTLTETAEKNVRIVRGDLRDEILGLKEQEGGPILAGGVDVPSQLIQLGLVDEYILVIHPVVVGEGRRLLEHVSLQRHLKLLKTEQLQSGCIILYYSKA